MLFLATLRLCSSGMLLALSLVTRSMDVDSMGHWGRDGDKGKKDEQLQASHRGAQLECAPGMKCTHGGASDISPLGRMDNREPKKQGGHALQYEFCTGKYKGVDSQHRTLDRAGR